MLLERMKANGIKTKKVCNSLKEEVNKRLQILTQTQLNDTNLIKAINTNVIPVAAYPMKFCIYQGGA